MNAQIDNKQLWNKMSKIDRKLTKLLDSLDPIKPREDRLITVKEAAQILNVSEQAIRQMIHNGFIQAQQCGGRAYKISQLQIHRILKDE